MPADEQVVIRIDIDADLAADRAKMTAFFKSLRDEAKLTERELDKFERRVKGLKGKFDDVDSGTNKVNKSMRRLTNTVTKVTTSFLKFFATFGKISFIASAIQIGLVGAALLGVKAALVTGRFAVRAYNVALTALGATAGGVAVGLGTVAAALREIQEVQLAPFTGGVRNAATAMRNVFNDQQLSFFGIEGLQGAVTALAQGGVGTDQSYTSILRKLGNFTPDPKHLQELAAAYADVAKAGVVTDSVFSTLAKVNPTLVKGLEELSGRTGDSLASAIAGGKIEKSMFDALLAGQANATDAFEGQLGRVSNTLVGMLKGALPRIYQEFADLGQPFIESVKMVLSRVESIISISMLRIRGSVTRFGLDDFIPGFLDMFQTLNDWLVRLINDSLPKVEGWVAKVGDLWNNIRGWFRGVAETFKTFEEGADILWETTKNIFRPFFSGFGDLMRGLNRMLVQNESGWLAFGDSLGNLVSAIFDWFEHANEKFGESLPIWTDFFNSLANDGVPILKDLFNILHEAAMVALPAIASILKAIAPIITTTATTLTALLKVPLLGQIVAMGMMPGFLGGGLVRGGIGLAGRGISWVAEAGGMAAALKKLPLLLRGGLVAAPAAVAGNVVGGVAGSNVQGAGGQALGILGGAATGAGIGAAIGSLAIIPIGTAAGAAIGGVAGGLYGWLSSRNAQQDAINQQNLEKMSYEEFFEALRANERYSETIKDLTFLTGMSTEAIGELASALKVDLASATKTVKEQMIALGQLSEHDFTLGGIRDHSTSFIGEMLFGTGSFFQREYVAPETAHSFDAAFREIAAIQARGERVPSALLQRGVSAWLQYGDEKFGNSGLDSLAVIAQQSAPTESHYGMTPGTLQALARNVENNFSNWFDPDKNPSILALRTQLFDFADSLGYEGEERDRFVESRLESDEKILRDLFVNAPQKVEERLDQMIQDYDFETLIQKQNLSADALERLGVAADQITAIFAGIGGNGRHPRLPNAPRPLPNNGRPESLQPSVYETSVVVDGITITGTSPEIIGYIVQQEIRKFQKNTRQRIAAATAPRGFTPSIGVRSGTGSVVGGG